LNLKGKYGNAMIKSILDQRYLDEYIISNIEESTKIIDTNKNEKDADFEDFFKILFKDHKDNFKMIDNIPLLISSKNFALIDYLDNIDYLNFDNYYYKKENLLNQIKKEYQFVNNYRIKRNI
jgi:hypothetical protein